MAQFIMRMIDWVVNDLVVKHLANSKTFQRFAVKTDEMIQTHTQKVIFLIFFFEIFFIF